MVTDIDGSTVPSGPTKRDVVLAHALDLARVADWLADHVDAMPDVDVSAGQYRMLTLFPRGPEEMAACVRWLALGSRVDQPVTKEVTEVFVTVARQFGAFTIAASEYRTVLCERVKVGTELVQVPDPDAPPVPTITEKRDLYEWRCGSLLDPITTEGAF